jgi:hypothetical protein
MRVQDDFLGDLDTAEPHNIAFMLKTHRYRRLAGLDIPFAVFLRTFDWIDHPIVSLAAYELIICSLREHPEFGPYFVHHNRDRWNEFISLFKSPETFRGWAMTAADQLIEACSRYEVELFAFFRAFMMCILKGFYEEASTPEYWISIFTILAKLVHTDVLDEADVPEILQACTIAASNRFIVHPEWQNAFGRVMRCTSELLLTNVVFPADAIRIFEEAAVQCLANLDPRRATVLVALFQFVVDLMPFGVNPIDKGFLQPLSDWSNLQICVAYLTLVTATLRGFPEARTFIADHPEVVAMAMEIRARGAFAERIPSVDLFLVLIDVDPDWPRLFVECDVLQEIADLLLVADSLSSRRELVDGLLKVAQWMRVNSAVPELARAFQRDCFLELFQSIEVVEDELLRGRLAALRELVHRSE